MTQKRQNFYLPTEERNLNMTATAACESCVLFHNNIATNHGQRTGPAEKTSMTSFGLRQSLTTWGIETCE